MRQIDYSRHYLRFHNFSDEHFVAQGDADAAHPLRIAPGAKRALDIGCGMGFVVGGLKRGGIAEVFGIDSSVEQIAAAKKRELNVEIVAAERTIAYLEAHAGHFDLITAIDVLEHIPPSVVIDVIAAIHTALSPNGVFYSRVPNALSPIGARQLYIDWTHYTTFTEHSLDFILFNGDFKHIEIVPTDGRKFSLRGIPGWFARRLSRGWARITLAGEIGWSAALKVPMTPNIVGIATKLSEGSVAELAKP